MAGKVESPATPSSTTTSCSPSGFDWSPFVWSQQAQAQLYRSVSELQATPTSRRPHYNRQHNNQLYSKRRTALRCKQNVGTREWVNCKKGPCVELREELRHLLDCRYRLIGGCKAQCIPLKEELQKLRELEPKYATISDEQLGTRINGQSSFGETDNDELQAKLQAMTIEKYVITSPYSPSSPNLEEPFQSRVESRANDSQRENEHVVHVVELIRLDQAKLSVSYGNYRKGHEWKKLCFLGKGTFGSTYLCFDNHRNSHFAIKKLPVSSFHEDEVKIWQKFSGKHPNILDLYGAVKRDQRVLIFMEYMNGGSVGDYLAEKGAFSESNALKILQQVLSGLEFMHKLRIIHGDVKAANILMDDLCLQIKLADFGSCIDLRHVETSGPLRLAGTLAFMAPEVCRSETPSPSSDIWSSMCLLIQMLSAEAPWEQYRHQGDGLLFVIGSAKRPPKLPECSEPVQDIFAQGLNVVAAERPTAAALLRHRVFNIDDEEIDSYDDEPDDIQDEDELSNLSEDSDDEYHSSHSLDTSDEYFSFEEDTDNIPVMKRVKSTANTRDIRRVDSSGGHLKLTNAHVTIPANALDANTTLAISSIDPGKYYQTIIDNSIQDKVIILGDAYKLRPSGLKFRGNVTVRVTLPQALHQSEDLRVFHGTFDQFNKLSWTLIEIPTPVLSFQDSAKVTVTINHFSILLFVKTLPSFAYEYLSTYLNFQAVLFRFIVLTRRDENNPRRLNIRVVIVRDSFYLNTAKEVFKRNYICHQYEGDGFCEMFGSRREYICPKEDFEITIEGSRGERVCTPVHHSLQNVFGGEKVANCELDTSGDEVEQPISGTVVIRRAAGQVYRFQFWQHEPTRYVKDVLKLSTLRYTNLLPVARALGLDQEEVNDLVERTGGDEEKQLQQITERWKTNAENNELPELRKFVASVPREAILVSDRGKSHLGHLSDFSQKWSENITNESSEGRELYLRKMAENGENICQSVFSDCLLQTDHSEDTVRLATTPSKLSVAMEKLLEKLRENYSQSVREKLSTLVRVFVSYDESKTDASRCQEFCQDLFHCIPWLMQVVKDCFKIHQVTRPTGMWGLHSQTDSYKETEEEKPSSDVWCEISDLLRNLCEKNSTDSDQSELEDMDKTLNVSGFLKKLSITDKAWSCFAARLRYYHRFSKEITKGKLSRTHSQDLENVLQCLRRYVSFCPTRLVQFCFSTGRVEKERRMSFEESSNTFTQKCSVSLEDTALDLSVKVEVFIRGSWRSAERHFTLTRCEKQEESHGECTKLIVVYQHQWKEAGMLRITNDCQILYLEQPVTEEPEEGMEEDVTDGNSNLLIKEGCPSDRELNEIASKVTEEWKALGRILLAAKPNSVNIIHADEPGVEEKTTIMFQKWKQAQGNGATYKKLYDALVDTTVDRMDIAQRYCQVKKAQARPRDTEL